MTVANVKSEWSGGDLYFYDKDGNEIMNIDGTNRQLEIPTGSALLVGGSTLSAAELAVLDVVAGTVTASKAVVVDSNKDAGDFRNLDAVNVDAGASGTAGTVDVFPATASTGKIQIAAADNAGNTTTTITNASQAGARTYTIPDAGASASFAMTEGAQTLNGVQTYTLPRVADHNTGITAFATGGQASATALTGEWNNVTTCATAGDSVKLPAAVAGQVITVKNSGATTLAVFPASADAINALAINLSVDIPPSAELTFRAIDATTWETCEVLTLPSPTTQTGNLVIQAAASAGNTNTTITNASQAAARTYTIPDAGGNASFVMTEGAQTVNGVKTFGSIPIFPTGGITLNATTITEAEAGVLDSVTPGTAAASKALVTDANSAVNALRTAQLLIGASGSEVDKTNVVIGAASGYKIARSATPLALDGSNPTSAAHGLTTCVAAFATLAGSAAPGLSTSLITVVINGANLDFYAWKPTGAGDTTLIASTGTETFNWFAIGT